MCTHRYTKTGPGIETCAGCDEVRFIAYTDDEIDRFDARDALRELRAEQEAADLCSDGEADLIRHRVER